MEFLGGTIPTSADDRLLDFDADGIPNAQEILEHTNPRTNDAVLRGAEGYRNEIKSLGVRNVPTMEDPDDLRAVSFRKASHNVIGGQAVLRWHACDQTLAWSDARHQGTPQFVPVPVPIDGTGVYTLYAKAEDNGELIEQIWAELHVTVPLLPTCDEVTEVTVFPLITVSDRNCYEVLISNIKLMETKPSNGETTAGINHILVFFTQAPESRLASPGIAKVAEIKVQYVCADPNDPDTCRRDPANGYVELSDDQFVTALP